MHYLRHGRIVYAAGGVDFEGNVLHYPSATSGLISRNNLP
ncbi:hypothetical protein LTSESEN_3858 [Salmonella enterica subsp. enterica serovar Senftenberg str. A4-543]|uniref:Uncharacterized protein n=1 Tax=Salmonella enterica subsp. enterica serovar Senftenberg str. A4-543 TaxID=913082 RepID=G5R326_SALSE|nr:hypothetical protein LTSESEN_3858 [Salmonella enterica subsp. enterica serovar Senftenberg str. A4-543]